MIIARRLATAIPFVEARHYTRNRKRPRTQGVVIHCTDGAEGPRKAEDVAAMMSKGWDEPKLWRSAHEVADTNSIVRMVPLDRRAYHCGAHGNDCLIGFELAGRASQTLEQWMDATSLPMLEIAAWRIAEIALQFSIPVYYADAAALKREERGITTHLDVTRAWGQTNHKDPGPGFPLADFIEAIRVARATLGAGP